MNICLFVLIFFPLFEIEFIIKTKQKLRMDKLSSQTILHRKYQLLGKKVGEGGLGRVFLAQNIETGENVAIKETIKEIKANSIYRQLSRNEIVTMEMLEGCPHILTIIDYFEKDLRQYIVSQFCEGGTLHSYIRDKKITPETMISTLRGIMKGCMEMERAEIIHRDLKPLNILFKNGDVKIADFGFATTLNFLSKEQNLSIGSLYYRAPESLSQHRYSSKSDVWSIGIILYEMLMGTVPWKERSKRNLYLSIIKNPITNKLPQKTELWIQKFLKKCLEPLEEKRATFSELLSLIPGSNLNEELSDEEKEDFKTETSSSNFHETFQIEAREKSKEANKNEESKKKINTVKSEKLLQFALRKENVDKIQAKFEEGEVKRQNNNKKANLEQSIRTTIRPNIVACKQISKTVISYIDFCRLQYELLKIFEELKKTSFIFRRECLSNNMEILIQNNMKETFKIVENLELKNFQACEIEEYRGCSEFVKIIMTISEYRKRYGLDKKIEAIKSKCFNQFMDWMQANRKEQMGELFFVLFDYMLNLKYLQYLSQSHEAKFVSIDLAALVTNVREARKKANKSRPVSNIGDLKEKMKKISLLQ